MPRWWARIFPNFFDLGLALILSSELVIGCCFSLAGLPVPAKTSIFFTSIAGVLMVEPPR